MYKRQLLRVEEKTELWGSPALRLNVTGAGTDEVYFVENEWEVDENAEWNEADYTLPAGKQAAAPEGAHAGAGIHPRGVR